MSGTPEVGGMRVAEIIKQSPDKGYGGHRPRFTG